MDNNFSKLNLDALKGLNITPKTPFYATGQIPPGLDAAIKSREERDLREKENQDNIRISAENSKEIVEKLQTQINQKDEDLQNQRELIHMLKQQLDGISRTLSDLFILEENSQELQDEANILAREIYSLIIQGKKIDWKSMVLDKGVDLIIAAIPIILQFAKVIN